MKRVAVTVAACVAALAAFGKEIAGKVTRVSDGDTVWVSDSLGRHKVRLNRIDAPESGQPYGKESAARLKSLIGGKVVCVEYTSTDQYGRILGIIFLGDTDINLQMVRDGCAWHYKHFDSTPAYVEAENDAQAAKRGLWAYPDPIPPWEFRKMQREQPRQVQLPPGVIGFVGGEPIFAKSRKGGFVQTSDLEKQYKRDRAKRDEEETRKRSEYWLSGQGSLDRARHRLESRMARRKAYEMTQLAQNMRTHDQLEQNGVGSDTWNDCATDVREKRKAAVEMENTQKAEVEWCQEQAEKGNVDAQYKLAYHYEKGWGVQKDIDLAVHWYRRAAAQGDSAAKTALYRLGER